ncbi:MAG: intermembrane phospholipid transport protein YdbH family protein [Inquilinaceae bacterium]
MLYGLAIALVLVIAGAVGLWLVAGPDLLARTAVTALAARGIPVEQVHIDRIGWRGATLSGIRAGADGAVEVQRMDLAYDPLTVLRDRKVDRATVEGLTVRLSVDADGAVTVAGLPLPAGSATDPTPAGPPSLPVDAATVRDATLIAETPWGRVTAPLSAMLETMDDSALRFSGEADPVHDVAAAGVTIDGVWAADGGLEADGDWTVTLATADVPGLAEDIETALAGRVAMIGGVVTATVAEPATVTGRTEALGGAWRADVAQAGIPGRPWLTVTMGAADRTVDLNATIRLQTGDASGTALVRAGAVQAGAAGWLATMETLTAEGGPVTVGGLTLNVADLRLSGSGTAEKWQVDVSLDLAVAGDAAGGLAVEEGRVAVTGTVAVADGVLAFRPVGCVDLSAMVLEIPGGARVVDGPALCLEALADAPLVTAPLSPGHPDGVALAARVPSAPLTVMVDGNGGAKRMVLRTPRADLVGSWRDGRGAGEATLTGGRADLPWGGLSLDGIGGRVVLVQGADRPVEARFAVEAVRLAGDPAPLRPVRVTGDAALTGDGRATATGRAVVGDGPALSFQARHDVPSGTGRIEATLAPMTFLPGGLQPAAISPALAGLGIAEATGALSGSARFAWGAAGGSDGSLDIAGLSFRLPGVAVTDLYGRIRADRLAPLRVPPGQRASVASVQAGILLEDGVMQFGIDDRRLGVTALGFSWASGSLRADPFVLRLGDTDRTITLHADSVDLAQVLAHTPVPDLEVSGRLSGRIPVRLTDDTMIIENGVLETKGPGVVRYRPTSEAPADADGSDNVALLLSAVRNFHYESLRMTIDGRTGEDLTVGLAISGANPDLYDGYPIVLNVNLEGPLDRILRSGLETLSIGRQAEEFFQRRAGETGR